MGPRVFTVGSGQAQATVVADALLSIDPASATPQSFVVEIFPVIAGVRGTFDINTALQAWKVAWMGVEN
jgi:hypothetical protein